ncbi:DUF5681 domain-containing protein [Pseudochelatococcus lubricantis]|uniref:DUF5681 domain-containing protein n=1 Tax=Pseudochelatococcus lubricantis TaxID=1538102 RepID=UPI0035E4768D
MNDHPVDDNAEGPAGETTASAPAYEVGYGSPPKHSRFKLGQSGNPKGRKKGTKNTGTLLQEILDEKIIVREGDREKKITRKEAWFRQLTNKALKGDAKATTALFGMLRNLGHIEPQPNGSNNDARRQLNESDQAIFKRLFPNGMIPEDSE